MHIPETWREHPLYKQGVVELVPTAWLYKYRGTDVLPITDLGNGSIVDMETLWDDLNKNGIHDPLIIRVGLVNKKFRLEAGNHRINVLAAHGIPYVPATVEVCELCGPEASDNMTVGTHNFDFSEEYMLPDIQLGYMKPSSVFGGLTTWNDDIQ